jgi:hypothetical protein
MTPAPSISSYHVDLPYSKIYQRQVFVIKNVGLSKIEAFNRWAFKKHPMDYNEHLGFIWENAHSSKMIDSDDPDQVLNEIVRLWKDRLNE